MLFLLLYADGLRRHLHCFCDLLDVGDRFNAPFYITRTFQSDHPSTVSDFFCVVAFFEFNNSSFESFFVFISQFLILDDVFADFRMAAVEECENLMFEINDFIDFYIIQVSVDAT